MCSSTEKSVAFIIPPRRSRRLRRKTAFFVETARFGSMTMQLSSSWARREEVRLSRLRCDRKSSSSLLYLTRLERTTGAEGRKNRNFIGWNSDHLFISFFQWRRNNCHWIVNHFRQRWAMDELNSTHILVVVHLSSIRCREENDSVTGNGWILWLLLPTDILFCIRVSLNRMAP